MSKLTQSRRSWLSQASSDRQLKAMDILDISKTPLPRLRREELALKVVPYGRTHTVPRKELEEPERSADIYRVGSLAPSLHTYTFRIYRRILGSIARPLNLPLNPLASLLHVLDGLFPTFTTRHPFSHPAEPPLTYVIYPKAETPFACAKVKCNANKLRYRGRRMPAKPAKRMPPTILKTPSPITTPAQASSTS